MTFALKLSSVIDAIGNIAITDVTVKDKDQLAGSWLAQPNVLYPNIDGPFLTDFSLAYASVLRAAEAPVDVRYTLHYRFLGVAIGDLAILGTAYSDLITKVTAIIDALQAVPSPYNGSVQMENIGISNLHPLPDPAGNMFYGCDFTLQIMELQN